DYAAARLSYAELARTAADAKAREDAEIALANIEWRIDGDRDAARARLAGVGTHRAWLEASRFDGEPAARTALALAATDAERGAAELALARDVIEAHVAARLSDAAPPASDLREAFDLVRRLDQGRLLPARLHLQAALLLGEGKDALAAWNSYFGATVKSTLLAPAAGTLERKLPAWRGGASDPIARALASSRLFDEAVLAGAGPDERVWARFLRSAGRLTDDWYRDLARGRGQRRTYEERFSALGREACVELKI